jgi:sarcosine oxidase subunit gamma
MVEIARRAATALSTPWLKVLPPAVRLAFNGDATAQRAALAVWGTPFPEDACRSNVHSTHASLWLGPDEYLMLDFAREPDAGALLAALENALAHVPHALVDVSHRQFALEVSGPFATTILSGACPLDLDMAAFPVGMCTRTVFAKADIVLWRRGSDTFHIEVWRSFSGYVTGVLQEIAAEFYPGR